RSFSNSFAIVLDEERSASRQVLDQFSVPSFGVGARGDATLFRSQSIELRTGFDVRHNQGQTNERFRNLGAGFTRLRAAGGEQTIAGGFAEVAADLGRLALTGGVRIDYWRIGDGSRREFNLETDTTNLALIFPDRQGGIPSGRIGARWSFTEALALNVAGYTAFRIPTLNELFRPFRVGNDITEANASLDPERLRGVDVGLSFHPFTHWQVSARGYYNELRDAIGNVTIGFGPGVFPVAGFVPAGGSLRERQNIDTIRAFGLELRTGVEPVSGTHIAIAYDFTDAEISAAADAAIIGLTPAQVARHRVSLGVSQQVQEWARAEVTVRYVGPQFDDDLNERRLPDFISADVAIDVALSGNWHLFARAENLFDTRIVTAVSGTGLETLGTPRLFRAGIDFRY
ncbi:MAG: TonB-dependent receptor, partial [Pseudomonadota bacterium]